MKESIRPEDKQDNIEEDRIELPYFEFGSSAEDKMNVLTQKIEELPLDEQEQYWRIMDNSDYDLHEKTILINDLLKLRNGDVEE